MAHWLRAVCKGPEFSPRHQHGGLQPSVTPGPEIWYPFLNSVGTWYTHGTHV